MAKLSAKWTAVATGAAMLVLYVLGPVIAGALGWGLRTGPVIYPETFHESLYIPAHELVRDEKPRLGMDEWMYRRPFFYGLPRRLKSPSERQAYIENAMRNQSPMLDVLIKMNREAEA